MDKAFELLNPESGAVYATYRNKQPRAAALKAAGNNVKYIILREKDSRNEKRAAKLHRFKGSVVPEKWKLPMPDWKIKTEEKRTGKTIPPKLNVKGKEAEFEKAGFVLPTRKKPMVRKVDAFDVPMIKGADLQTEVREFLKTLPKVA